MTMAMDKIVPDTLPWRHVDEGPDDSSSHTKVGPPSSPDRLAPHVYQVEN